LKKVVANKSIKVYRFRQLSPLGKNKFKKKKKEMFEKCIKRYQGKSFFAFPFLVFVSLVETLISNI